MQLSSKGKSAISLAQRGWYIFPLSLNGKAPRPDMTNWEGKATNDLIQITEWWQDKPNSNVGVATGPSGLVVLDFDEGGVANYRKAYPSQQLKTTFTVETASGGYHLYYKNSAGLRNTAGKLCPKVDTRAQGGYVVAPGSVIDGNEYTINHDIAVATLPGWIENELTKQTPAPRTNVKAKGDSTAYALAALRGECKTLAETTEGGRNHAANRAAWNVSRFVAAGELDQGRALNDLEISAIDCGLSAKESAAAVRSGMTRGVDYYTKKG